MRPNGRLRGSLTVVVSLGLLCVACSGSSAADSDRVEEDRATQITAEPAKAGEAPDPAARPEPTTDPRTVVALTDEGLATETYVAGYPLVVSTRTMQFLGGLVGVNQLFWQGQLTGPETRVIVAPNRDTLYSIAILDLRSGPLALTLPAVTDRYYTYQFLSAWTESFAYIGSRATGGEAGTWVIAPPGWQGTAPDGAKVIESPTPQAFLLGRFLVDDEADIANVLAIRDQSSLRPLTEVQGTTPGPALPPLGQNPGSPQEIPANASFYDELATALAVNPPVTDYQRALFTAAADRLGIAPGGDPTPVGPERERLDRAAGKGSEQVDHGIAERIPLEDGWRTSLEIGTYGDDLDLRAGVARAAWGANVPEEAVYPVATADAEGNPFDGRHSYTITFPPGGLPATGDLGFWSLTVYGADRFLVANPQNRYSVGDRTADLAPSPDGSVTITLAHDQPMQDPGASPVNWLPVPEGPFTLMLRIYLPGPTVLEGEYRTPPVIRSP